MLNKVLEKNLVGRDFIIGDLHGCLSQLNELLAHVGFNPTTDRLFSVGDLIDRGPDSFGCFQLLNQPWFHAVRGNHEEMACMAMSSNREESMGGKFLWSRNGGQWIDVVEDQSQIKALLESLPLVISVKDSFHVIHSEFKRGVVVTNEMLLNDPESLVDEHLNLFRDMGPSILWGRKLFRYHIEQIWDARVISRFRHRVQLEHAADSLTNEELWPVFAGHSVLRQPVSVFGRLINIDTGAFMRDWEKDNDWAGLTMVDFTNNKFWTNTNSGIREAQLLTIDP